MADLEPPQIWKFQTHPTVPRARNSGDDDEMRYIAQ